MRLPAWNTLLTSPLATHVWSGVSLTAAAARGRAPTKPPAMRATPATTAPRRWRRRGRRTRAVKAAARPEDWFTQMLLAEGGPASPGGNGGGPVEQGNQAGQYRSERPAHRRTATPPARPSRIRRLTPSRTTEEEEEEEEERWSCPARAASRPAGGASAIAAPAGAEVGSVPAPR